MKPQQQPAQDSAALEELGRASVQVVHDLKNQLNGLKLYATFLRRRAARPERPADELETVDKIIAGLERAAADTNALVRYGRPVELSARPDSDLAQILSAVEGDTVVEPGQVFRGEFDVQALTEALQSLSTAARGNSAAGQQKLLLTREKTVGEPVAALIEWVDVQDKRLLDAAKSLSGSGGLRVALAAKIIRAHGGEIEQEANTLRVRLPIKES
jgi:signal transduction histidine kinase